MSSAPPPFAKPPFAPPPSALPSFAMIIRNAMIAGGLIAALSGCDRETAQPAQEQGGLDATKQSLSGTIDDSRAGTLLPALNVAQVDGTTLNLGALQGQPVLINLWATWCAPCVVEMPMLDDLARDMDGPLRVLTISQDLTGAEAVEPFFAKMDFAALEPWLDPENTVSTALGGGVLPTTVLFDETGQEVWRVVGEYDWSSAEAREAIAAGIAN